MTNYKNRGLLLTFNLIIILNVLLSYAVKAVSPIPLIKPKLAFDSITRTNADCDATATISGSNCLGSTLSLRSNVQLSSISWVLNGTTTVSTQTATTVISAGTVAAGGNGSGSALNQINAPDRIYIDPVGNIYVPELGNSRVTKWAPGATSGIIVAGGNGTGSAANQLNRPTSVWVDSQGNVFITDQNNNRIQKWAPGATTGTTVISYVNYPTGICIDAQNNIYVSEQYGNDVRKFAPGANSGTIVASGISSPTGIFVDAAGNLYVCNTDYSFVQKWAPGAVSGIIVAGGNGSGSNANQLANPLGVCVDASGNVYVGDYNNNRIQKWAPGATSGVTVSGNINNPSGLWIDASYNLFVAELGGSRVLKFPYIIDTFTPTIPGNYTANIVSVGSCTATSNVITVVANQTPSVTIVANTAIVCPQYQPQFTANPVNGGVNPLFQWRINGVNIGPNSSSSTFTGSNLKAGNIVSCVLTSDFPCVTSPTATSNFITLINPAETPSVTINTGNTTVCEGSDVVFTATAQYGGLLPTYQWFINSVPAGGVSTSNIFTASGIKNGDKIKCVMVSSATVCQLASTASSEVIPLKVNPVLKPAASITANTSPVYAGSVTTFTCIASKAGLTPTYDWQINGISTGVTAAVFKNTTQLIGGDKITCVVTSSDLCATENIVQSNVIVVTPAIQNFSPPNTFTPNNDGINDTWKMESITAFPDCRVSVFTRGGQLVFDSIGYVKEWDGIYKGNALSVGTYYYLIKLNSVQTVSGAVNLIR